MTDSIPPIVETLVVTAPPERAYAVFKDSFGAWWPADYTYSGAGGLHSISLGQATGIYAPRSAHTAFASIGGVC
jgi:hypothetical protein